MSYTLIVGNVGSVAESDHLEVMVPLFDEYVRMSVAGYGRVAGEPVVLLGIDGVVKEHLGEVAA